MMALWGLMLNTLRETVRQAFYPLLLVVGAAIVILMIFVPLSTLGSNVDMYKDAGLSIVLLFALLGGLLGAATGIAKEVDERTAATVLAKPMGRWKFVLGKYFGVLMASAFTLAVLGVVFMVGVYYRVEMEASPVSRAYGTGEFAQGDVGFFWHRINQALTVVPGLLLAFFQVAVLIAFTTALSTRLSAIASVALGLGCFIIGHLTAFLELATKGSSALVRGLSAAIVTAVPFLDTFNINAKLSHVVLVTFGDATASDYQTWSEVWGYVGFAGMYALVYTAVVLVVAGLLFRGREIG